MKKLSFTKIVLPVGAIMFILQSCCFMLPEYGAKTKPCNCGNKQQLAAKQSPAENSPVVASKTNSKVISNVQEVRVDQKALTIREINTAKPFSEKKLPLGIKGISTNIIAGPNMSFKTSKEDFGGTNHKNKPGAGVQLGVAMSYAFSEKFAVAPALLFKSNSATESLSYSIPGEPGSGGTSDEIKTKYSFSYLSLPVMAEIKISDQLTLMAGPELNLLLGAHAKSSGYGETDKTDIKDNSVKTGLGVQGGIKYQIPNSPIGIQLIYDQRISRLNEKTSSEYYPGGGGGYEVPAWNMKSIQVGVTCAICELMKKKK